MNKIEMLFRRVSSAIMAILLTPTEKQLAKYADMALNLCAASLIGLVTKLAVTTAWAFRDVAQVSGLLFVAVLLFLVGAMASKGGSDQ